MTRLIAPVEAARRARAAIAYAGLEQDEAATRTGISLGTLRNIVSKTRPSSGDIDRLYAIADACNVPRSFMDEGFGAADHWAELENVRADIEELRDQLAQVLEAVASDRTREMITATRAVKRAGEGQAVGDSSTSGAVGGTHGKAGATRESPPARRGAKQ